MLFKEENLLALPLEQHSAEPVAGPPCPSQMRPLLPVQEKPLEFRVQTGILCLRSEIHFQSPLLTWLSPFPNSIPNSHSHQQAVFLKVGWNCESLRLRELKDTAKAESDSLFYCPHWGSQGQGSVSESPGFSSGHGLLVLCKRREVKLKTHHRVRENRYIDWHHSMLNTVANTPGYLLFPSSSYRIPISRGWQHAQGRRNPSLSLREWSIIGLQHMWQFHSLLPMINLGVNMWPSSWPMRPKEQFVAGSQKIFVFWYKKKQQVSSHLTWMQLGENMVLGATATILWYEATSQRAQDKTVKRQNLWFLRISLNYWTNLELFSSRLSYLWDD